MTGHIQRIDAAFAAIKLAALTGDAATLLLYVAHRDGLGRGCFASVEKMTDELGWSPARVKRARAKLVASKSVTYKRAGRSPAILQLAGSPVEPTNPSPSAHLPSRRTKPAGSPVEPHAGSPVEPTQQEGTRKNRNSPAVVPAAPHAHAPAPARAAANGRTTSLPTISRIKLAEDVCGILHHGIDGLTNDEPSKAPTSAAILAALEKHNPTNATAIAIAIEVRSIAQAQNRAPNIAGLYATKLGERVNGHEATR